MSLIRRALDGRLLYVQVLFVFIAFGVMVFSSYMYSRNVEREHLEREADSMLTNVESRLYSNLHELETMLGVVSESIGGMISHDTDIEELNAYITYITNYGYESEIVGFLSVFALYEMPDLPRRTGFSGIAPDTDWAELDASGAFVPEERDWFILATEANGKIVTTDPYLDVITGEVVLAYARALYDEDGNRIAIVALNVTLSRIYEFASQNQSQSVNYWMLFDSNMNFIAHPNPDFVGRHLTELGTEHINLFAMLQRDESISGQRIRTYTGESNIISGRQIYNGWYMGVVTRTDSYYENLQNMQWFLLLLGMTLAAILSFILIRMYSERAKMEERMRLMIDSSPLCINFWDSKYNNIDCNQTAVKFFGLKSKQEYLERYYELSPEFQPDGKSSLEKKNMAVQKALDEGFYRLEWMNQLLDGTPVLVDLTLVRVRYKNKYIVITYTRDLRKEKALVKSIVERDALLTTVNLVAETLLLIKNDDSFEEILLESMELVGCAIDADRVHIWRNSEENDARTIIHSYEWLSKYGEELDGIPIGLGIPFEKFPKWEGIFKRGDCIHGAVSTLSDDFREFCEAIDIKSVVVLPLYVRGRFWGMLTLDNCRNERIFTDEEISILRSAGLMMVNAIIRSKSIEQLNEEREKNEELAHWYHSILDAIPLPVSVTDEFMNWTYVNRAVENLTGNKRNTMIGMHCSNLKTHICNTDECGVFCARRGVKQTYFTHNDLFYKIDVEILRDLNGETSGYVEIIQDITEIEAMAKKQAEAEAASSAKSAFLATVSHEIRTPMNTILGIAEIQLQNDTHPPVVEEAFTQICDSGDLLLNIINDILDLSKIEAGKLDITPVRYDIPSLINDTVQLNYLRYESKPIEFKINLDVNTPLELFGDAFRIKQILNNLLSNAFKYTDEGTVEFSIFSEPIENSSPTEEEKYDTMLKFRVSDTGAGMDADQIHLLFNEFSRFNANQAIAGTGLGMSITKRLLSMMEGSIKVDSTPGKGTVFEIGLPQKKVAAVVCGAELAEKFKSFDFKSRARLKKAQIVREYMPYGSVLIVDDMALNLQVAKGLMMPYSLQIETVLSGIEAVEMVQSGKQFDIIFMDHMMPYMNGVVATKLIREFGYSHPIVALTANALAGQEEMFKSNGFDGFISKPIDSRELNQILNEFIRNKKPREVVEAAREEQREKEKKSTPLPFVTGAKERIPDIERYFVKDAENAVAVLEGLYKKNLPFNDEDVELYITTVHGMKSALANIGETELSAVAYKLEQAGNERDFTLMSDKTPVFISVLKSLIDKYMPEETIDIVILSDKETAELRERLLEIKAACNKYDKQAAKEIISELKEKPWPEEIGNVLDEIDAHLLHSAFKKAAALAEDTGGSL